MNAVLAIRNLMTPRIFKILLCLTVVAAGPPPASVGGPTDYADTADLTLSAPLVIHAHVTRTVQLKGEDAAGVPTGKARVYVEAAVDKLLYGRAGAPPMVNYLVDMPVDAKGRPAKFKGAPVLLFASALNSDQLRLAAPDAQIDWTPATDQRVRSILQSAQTAEGRISITGVGNAFHVEGSIPGESETQIFLTTANAQPVSLSILHRPGEQPRWSVALSEMTDDAAAAPARDTLLWYRLACALPQSLPASTLERMADPEARAATEDYRFVIQSLGQCGRTRS